MIGIHITGDRAAMRMLRRLPEAIQRKALRPAIQQAVRPIRDIAKQTAPVETGLLRKSIGDVVRTHKRTQAVYALVGPRRGFRVPLGRNKKGRPIALTTKKQRASIAAIERGRGRSAGKTLYRNPAKYAHLVERGTKRGVKPTRFLERAAQRGEHKAQEIFRRVLTIEVDKQVMRLRAKGRM